MPYPLSAYRLTFNNKSYETLKQSLNSRLPAVNPSALWASEKQGRVRIPSSFGGASPGILMNNCCSGFAIPNLITADLQSAFNRCHSKAWGMADYKSAAKSFRIANPEELLLEQKTSNRLCLKSSALGVVCKTPKY
jgi:hypothetical protein